jgi:hypothetical protein
MTGRATYHHHASIQITINNRSFTRWRSAPNVSGSRHWILHSTSVPTMFPCHNRIQLVHPAASLRFPPYHTQAQWLLTILSIFAFWFVANAVIAITLP